MFVAIPSCLSVPLLVLCARQPVATVFSPTWDRPAGMYPEDLMSRHLPPHTKKALLDLKAKREEL